MITKILISGTKTAGSQSEQLSGGKDMLDHIYRLITGFERAHGVLPNTLYLNETHCEHLKSVFDEGFSLEQIMEVLQMEVIIDREIMHPHVAWTQAAHRMAS
jgi:hypothetical protein